MKGNHNHGISPPPFWAHASSDPKKESMKEKMEKLKIAKIEYEESYKEAEEKITILVSKIRMRGFKVNLCKEFWTIEKEDETKLIQKILNEGSSWKQREIVYDHLHEKLRDYITTTDAYEAIVDTEKITVKTKITDIDTLAIKSCKIVRVTEKNEIRNLKPDYLRQLYASEEDAKRLILDELEYIQGQTEKALETLMESQKNIEDIKKKYL